MVANQCSLPMYVGVRRGVRFLLNGLVTTHRSHAPLLYKILYLGYGLKD